MVAHAEGGLYQTLLLTTVLTGARIGEVTALRWADVDLVAGKLTIRRSVSWAKARGQKDSEPRFYKPKTSAGARTLMVPELTAALKRWKLQSSPNPSGLLFATIDGRPKHRKTITHEGLRPALTAAEDAHRRAAFPPAHVRVNAADGGPDCARGGQALRSLRSRRHQPRLCSLAEGDQHAEALAALGGEPVVASGGNQP